MTRMALLCRLVTLVLADVVVASVHQNRLIASTTTSANIAPQRSEAMHHRCSSKRSLLSGSAGQIGETSYATG